MTVAVVVFARLDSSRLPGKALTPIAGRKLLDRVLDRVERTPGAPGVIVATSDRTTDDPIASHVTERGARVFRGAGQDVAGRALACATANGLERFARISGDSPFIDPALIGDCIGASEQGNAELVTNVFPRSYPVGVSVEVLTTAAMARIVEETEDPEDREHVTRYAYRHPERFRMENRSAGHDRYEGLSLAVDTPDDLARAEWIFGTHGDDVDLETAAAAAREWEARG